MSHRFVVFLVCRVLGSDAGQNVDAAVAEALAGDSEGADVGVVDDAVDHGAATVWSPLE